MRIRMVKENNKSKAMYACDKCGYAEGVKKESKPIEAKQASNEAVIKVIEDESDIKTLPVTTAECPKCGNKEAFWWMVQTRSADEPTTQFFRCTKCNYTWRHYA
jgi:DNA-directed RNA polymerase subunit M